MGKGKGGAMGKDGAMAAAGVRGGRDEVGGGGAPLGPLTTLVEDWKNTGPPAPPLLLLKEEEEKEDVEDAPKPKPTSR